MRHPTFLVSAAAVAAVLAGCSSAADAAADPSTGDGSTSVAVAGESVTEAMAANTAPAKTPTSTGDEVEIDLGNPASGDGYSADGSTITITAAGTYRISGTLPDGSVVVNTADEGIVTLVLDDASLSSSTTSPLQ